MAAMPYVMVYSERFGEEPLIFPERGGKKTFRNFCRAVGREDWLELLDDDWREFDLLVRVRCDADGSALYERECDGGNEYLWIWPPDVDGLCVAAGGWMKEDPKADDLVDKIEGAETLDALASALRALTRAREDVREAVERRIDFSELPIFGGPEPGDVEFLRSWDETRLLVGEVLPFRLVPRDFVGELL